MKSLSEIETIAKRASRAAGFSWGVAEEVAKGVRLLELYGFQGIKNLNQYFIDRKKYDYENLNLINKENISSKSSFCPILIGVSILDQIKKIEPLKKINFNEVSYPILLLPFLSRSSEIIGKKLLFKFDDNKFLLNFNINISSTFINRKFISVAKDIEINFLENEDSFSAKDWQSLYKLSEKTFVEETDTLKHGAAGAGLTDND